MSTRALLEADVEDYNGPIGVTQTAQVEVYVLRHRETSWFREALVRPVHGPRRDRAFWVDAEDISVEAVSA